MYAVFRKVLTYLFGIPAGNNNVPERLPSLLGKRTEGSDDFVQGDGTRCGISSSLYPC